jgi:hypothetical protein
MILESLFHWENNWLARISSNKRHHQNIYEDIILMKMTSIYSWFDSRQENEYGTIQFALIETIGKIKINQLVENELILEALTIINLNFFCKNWIACIIFLHLQQWKKAKKQNLARPSKIITFIKNIEAFQCKRYFDFLAFFISKNRARKTSDYLCKY